MKDGRARSCLGAGSPHSHLAVLCAGICPAQLSLLVLEIVVGSAVFPADEPDAVMCWESSLSVKCNVSFGPCLTSPSMWNSLIPFKSMQLPELHVFYYQGAPWAQHPKGPAPGLQESKQVHILVPRLADHPHMSRRSWRGHSGNNNLHFLHVSAPLPCAWVRLVEDASELV